MMDALNVTTVLLAAVTCVTILAGSWYLIHTRDPYKHLNRTQNQNKENSDADQVKWMNMGWWTVSDGHKQPVSSLTHTRCGCSITERIPLFVSRTRHSIKHARH